MNNFKILFTCDSLMTNTLEQIPKIIKFDGISKTPALYTIDTYDNIYDQIKSYDIGIVKNKIIMLYNLVIELDEYNTSMINILNMVLKDFHHINTNKLIKFLFVLYGYYLETNDEQLHEQMNIVKNTINIYYPGTNKIKYDMNIVMSEIVIDTLKTFNLKFGENDEITEMLKTKDLITRNKVINKLITGLNKIENPIVTNKLIRDTLSKINSTLNKYDHINYSNIGVQLTFNDDIIIIRFIMFINNNDFAGTFELNMLDFYNLTDSNVIIFRNSIICICLTLYLFELKIIDGTLKDIIKNDLLKIFDKSINYRLKEYMNLDQINIFNCFKDIHTF